MPELPEVEIVRQSLDKKIKQKKVKKVIIRNRNLRLKIPLNFSAYFLNKKIIKVCLLYTSPSPRDRNVSRMPSSA